MLKRYEPRRQELKTGESELKKNERRIAVKYHKQEMGGFRLNRKTAEERPK